MDMLKVFHMNKGGGETSYAKNCIVQEKIISIAKSFVEEAIKDYFSTYTPETLAMADLGCSSGPTALAGASNILDAVYAVIGHDQRRSPSFMVFVNDLPENDFNEVFASLSNFHKKLRKEKDANFGPCFIAGLPGSFHGRLLPDNSLHFVYSSSSLHWLSQVPPGLDAKNNPKTVNKGKIYISKTSPRYVMQAYMLQFRKDFLSFLKCRSEELVSGGRMVFTLLGRRSNDPTSEDACDPWELLAKSLLSIASEGLIEEEKVDSFNVPFYAPCIEELKQATEEEASFVMVRSQAFDVDWYGREETNKCDQLGSSRPLTRGERAAMSQRVVLESIMEHQFGREVMDELFLRHGQIVDDHLSKRDYKYVNLAVSLIRK